MWGGNADGGGILAGVNTKNHRPGKTPDGDPSETMRAASECFDIEHLAVTIIAAGRAGNVRRHLAPTLRATLEDRRAPALGATTHFLTAFGLAALWNGHGLEFG
jgi:hypothetical protein